MRNARVEMGVRRAELDGLPFKAVRSVQKNSECQSCGRA